jgi:predicted nucleotidyltransferase
MNTSINSILVDSANRFYINNDSSESIKIDKSVDALKFKMIQYFELTPNSIVEFGSYKRGTILPRQFDENSDIDLMINFGNKDQILAPGTYRNKLISFCSNFYKFSRVYKSSPTVVLELDHIKYDLVPACITQISIYNPVKYFIPENDSNWMETNPVEFNSELIRVNGVHGFNIKKVIRLIKAWNAKVNYPLNSFELEKEITRHQFLGCYNLQDYFFSAIDSITEYRYNNVTATLKIRALKENKLKVMNALFINDINTAKNWLSHILPS